MLMAARRGAASGFSVLAGGLAMRRERQFAARTGVRNAEPARNGLRDHDKRKKQSAQRRTHRKS